MKSGRQIIWLATLVCAGCQPGTSAMVKTREATARADLNNVLHTTWGDIVRGRLIITGASTKLASANLSCFYLRIGSHESKELKVDSFVDYRPTDWPASEGKVSVDVYWPMKDFRDGTDADLANAKLEFKPPASGSCFKFSP